MFGNGHVTEVKTDTTGEVKNAVMRTETFVATKTTTTATVADATSAGWSEKYVASNGKQYTKKNAKFYNANENSKTKEGVEAVTAFKDGQGYYCTYDLEMEGSIIDINADTFPGMWTNVMHSKRGNKKYSNQFHKLLENPKVA